MSTDSHKVFKRLYSIPEAAQYLGRSTWSVRHLVWSGELPEVRAGRRVHLDIKDMDAFIEMNKQCEEKA
jgi:excisionase family DNA binding protein